MTQYDHPLEGVVAAEIGCGIVGAIAGYHLRLLGAKVIHICVGDPCDLATGDLPLDYNRGKELLVLASPDEVLKTVPPDVLLKDEYDSRVWQDVRLLWPQTILVDVTARDATNQGLLAEASTGLIGEIGFEETGPQPLGFLFGEVVGAVHCVAGVLQQLIAKRASEPADIAVSLEGACIASLDSTVQDISFGHRTIGYSGPHRRGLLPYGLFRGPDGFLGIAGSWDNLVRVMGDKRFESPEFSSYEGRSAKRPEVLAGIGEWLNSLSSIDEAAERIGNLGISERAQTLGDVWLENDGELWNDERGTTVVSTCYLVSRTASQSSASAGLDMTFEPQKLKPEA